MNYINRLITILLSAIFLLNLPFQWFSNVLVSAKLSEKALENILFAARSELKPFLQVTNQTKDFQQHVLQQVYSLFNPRPTQPSVLFFLVPADSEETSKCLAKKLQKIVSRAFKDKKLVSFDCNDVKLEDDSVIFKRILSDKLSSLKNNHVVILSNIELLPPEAIMFLSSYLDNESIVRKRTLIVLTMKTSLPFDLLPQEKVKNYVENTLEDLWRGKVRNADISPILSRITSSVVPVKPESRDVIATVCSEKDEL